MNKLLDKMIKKRLCLSYNSDISELYNHNGCNENYMHISCIFKGNLKTKSCFKSIIIWYELT